MHACVGMYIYSVCMCGYVYIVCVYVYTCTYLRSVLCVGVNFPSPLGVRLRATAIAESFGEVRIVTGDLFWYSLWTRYTGDSKIDPWDDSKIRTSSCSENQTAIQIQNCVISCERFFLSIFPIYCCQ